MIIEWSIRASLSEFMGRVCLPLGMSIIATLCQFDRHAQAQVSAAGNPSAMSDVQAEVEGLINRLDAPQLAVREQAEKDLIAKGIEIFPFLEPKKQLSPEASLRLNRVRSALVDRIVTTETLPTRVTCKVTGAPLGAVISEIARQTGNAITVDDELGQSLVTWDCQDKTFWEAIDDLTETLRLDCEPAENGGLTIVPRKTMGFRDADTSVDYGAFRIQLREVAKVNRGGSEMLFATIDIIWEPRLQPAVIWLRSIGTGVGGLNDVNASQGAFSRREVPVSPRKCFVSLSVPVELAGQGSERAVTLRGSFEVVLPVARLDVAFDMSELRQRSRTVFLGQAEITAKSGRSSEETCEVVLRIRYQDPFDAFASHRGWFYSWPIYLEVGSERLSPNEVQLASMSEDGVELLYRFAHHNGSNGRLVCRVPVAIVRPIVEFQLPLPSGE